MDITYLLWVQDLRNAINSEAVNQFLEQLSFFAISWAVMIPVLVYWCINKKNGLFLYVSFCISWFINGLIKLTVCAYRPWIRDARIVPAGDAIRTAGGYSFPSGHTMQSSPIYGGLAVLCRKSAAIVSCFFVLLILVTAFSRNYLGVHTPQDVVVGTVCGLCSVWVAAKIIAYCSNHPERENILLLLGLILSFASIYYITHKTYPLDYKADGSLLVDPQRMMNDTFLADGMLAGFVIGRFIEKTFIKFESTGLKFGGLIVALIGFVPLYFIRMSICSVYSFITVPLNTALGSHWGHFAIGFIEFLYTVAIWPAVIKLCTRK